MIHTAATTLLTLLALVVGPPGPGPQDKVGRPTQNPDIKRIIDNLKQRERTLKSVSLEMSTTSSYPSGTKFRTDGKLRVLGTTHFLIEVTSRFFGRAELQSRLRKAITPEGTWTFQSGPVEGGGVYTHMDKDLMVRLRKAERALAADRDTAMRNPGPMAGKGDAPLGSAMLAALDLQFELAVQAEKEDVDGVPCKVIRGKWRGFKGLDEDQINRAGRAVQRVEVFVREADGIPIRMVQYNKVEVEPDDPESTLVDEIAFELRIKNLELDPKLDPAMFKLEAPEGTKFLPVMKHRPSRAQINRILEEYADLVANRPPKKGK
jgi:hypothetical protein